MLNKLKNRNPFKSKKKKLKRGRKLLCTLPQIVWLFPPCYLKKRDINLPGQLIAHGVTGEELGDYVKGQQLLLHPDLHLFNSEISILHSVYW